MKWMLDTETCIALINRQPRELIKRLRTKAVGDVGISSITLRGAASRSGEKRRRDQNRAAWDRLLLPLDIAAFDDLAADLHGTVRADLETAGTRIGPLDTLVAGHAVSPNVVLVTHNVAEFQRVPGLRIEDWPK